MDSSHRLHLPGQLRDLEGPLSIVLVSGEQMRTSSLMMLSTIYNNAACMASTILC